MGPQSGSTTSARRQAPWVQRRKKRLCLLKECEEWFLPDHPSSRYSRSACEEGAREWSRWKARTGYRASQKGKERRRAQSERHRTRRAEESTGPAAAGRQAPVGHHHPVPAGFSSCDRPGCYEPFERTKRSPDQRFCAAQCRKALRRVRLREARLFSRVRPRLGRGGSVGRVSTSTLR